MCHDLGGFERKTMLTPSVNVCSGDPVTLGLYSNVEDC